MKLSDRLKRKKVSDDLRKLATTPYKSTKKKKPRD